MTYGAPMALKDTYCAIEREYDEYGNVCEQRFYDENGELMLCRNGYAIERDTWRAAKEMTAAAYYGTDGAPICCRADMPDMNRSMTATGTLIISFITG